MVTFEQEVLLLTLNKLLPSEISKHRILDGGLQSLDDEIQVAIALQQRILAHVNYQEQQGETT